MGRALRATIILDEQPTSIASNVKKTIKRRKDGTIVKTLFTINSDQNECTLTPRKKTFKFHALHNGSAEDGSPYFKQIVTEFLNDKSHYSIALLHLHNSLQRDSFCGPVVQCSADASPPLLAQAVDVVCDLQALQNRLCTTGESVPIHKVHISWVQIENTELIDVLASLSPTKSHCKPLPKLSISIDPETDCTRVDGALKVSVSTQQDAAHLISKVISSPRITACKPPQTVLTLHISKSTKSTRQREIPTKQIHFYLFGSGGFTSFHNDGDEPESWIRIIQDVVETNTPSTHLHQSKLCMLLRDVLVGRSPFFMLASITTSNTQDIAKNAVEIGEQNKLNDGILNFIQLCHGPEPACDAAASGQNIVPQSNKQDSMLWMDDLERAPSQVLNTVVAHVATSSDCSGEDKWVKGMLRALETALLNQTDATMHKRCLGEKEEQILLLEQETSHLKRELIEANNKISEYEVYRTVMEAAMGQAQSRIKDLIEQNSALNSTENRLQRQVAELSKPRTAKENLRGTRWFALKISNLEKELANQESKSKTRLAIAHNQIRDLMLEVRDLKAKSKEALYHQVDNVSMKSSNVIQTPLYSYAPCSRSVNPPIGQSTIQFDQMFTRQSDVVHVDDSASEHKHAHEYYANGHPREENSNWHQHPREENSNWHQHPHEENSNWHQHPREENSNWHQHPHEENSNWHQHPHEDDARKKTQILDTNTQHRSMTFTEKLKQKLKKQRREEVIRMATGNQ